MSKAAEFLPWFGLKLKFILFTTLAIVVFMSILGYIAVVREKSLLYSEVEKQGRLLGETLAIPIINDLIYERLGLVEEGGLLDNYILEVFNKKDVDLLYITILDEDGKVISHNKLTEYGKVYTDPLTVHTLRADRITIQRMLSGEHQALDFGVPLSIGKKRWGSLKFAISLKKVEHAIRATVRTIILITIFMLVVGFVIILLLTRRFIGPITALVSTMERARGDYLDVRVEVKGHDELAVLGERFNSMIARIRHANEELKKAHEKLVQSEKLASVGILAAGVAHEINNPLAGIFNCLAMLKRNDDNPELRAKHLELVREGLDRIEATVSKLLWMARKGEHAPVEINVRNSVDSVYSFLGYKMKKVNIAFENEVDADLRLNFDVHDFQQLLLNLFINAIHAMEKGGTLAVRGGRKDSLVFLEVSDNGCGIARENIGKVFDPFFTTKPTGEGTGLGLWLTYEIIRNYGGEISVDSDVEKGSRFIMSFPVQGVL